MTGNLPEVLDLNEIKATIATASRDPNQVRVRFELARYVGEVFAKAGEELLVYGQIVGPDRKAGKSPFGHGSDETVAVGTILQIGSQLVSGGSDLFKDGRSYAAAALLRQLVEIEYLAWAMEANSGEAEKWMRSDKRVRQDFFSPRKLREAAKGKFRSQDYGYHCENGGHPVPTAGNLLAGGAEVTQVLLSDLIGHTGRIWEHLVRWAEHKPLGAPILKHTPEMRRRFTVWKKSDQLLGLPPPP